MALETATYIDGLNASNPVATDGLSQADDHMRLIKSTIKATFPNLTGAVTPTQAELNIIDGSTSATSTTLATADRLVVNDDGTMVQVALSDLVTFLGDQGFFQGAATGWKTETSGQDLLFKYNNVTKMKLESNGNLTVTGNITAYGTV